ncbi:hypothetical protein [Flavobacterium caeni]|uniref:Uncharacterized protein n=1 Tax=Flavobacterium caeni TaxID=490189 RepID=A0A1G5K1Z3_9FLAO|nr:hypothetical protein [Flavobacterium caeni]SCY94241.1 hypothetical protein SAMN02927903_03015 [Flavobacterium caeni]
MTKEEIKNKMQTGDYLTLAKMLKLDNPDAARKRFMRNKADAIAAMETIVMSREQILPIEK